MQFKDKITLASAAVSFAALCLLAALSMLPGAASAVAHAMDSQDRTTEIVVHVEGGPLIAVVQQMTCPPLGDGDPVDAVQSDRAVRVVLVQKPVATTSPPSNRRENL